MINSLNRSRFSRFIAFVIDESPIWVWLLIFSAIIVIFGILFAFLTPLGHGMTVPGEIDRTFNLGRGFYFSVVTVSSLGYGDLHPEGIGKVLAGVEVVLGLVVIGIVIAKLTSKCVSHFASRLFVSETKRQLQNSIISLTRAVLSLACFWIR